jgi:two-component system phosphate regulon sensor histidine kinase PhoR
MLLWIIPGIVLAVLVVVLLRLMQLYQTTYADLRLSQSERRTLQDRLQNEIRLRESLLTAIPEGLLVLDESQHINIFNAAAESLVGQSLTDKTLIAATRDYELDTLVRQRDEEDDEVHLHIKNRIIRARITHFETGSILVLHDETELVRLTVARREMVANIGHELRHPIQNIGLLAETLLSDNNHKPKKVRKMLKNIRRETDTLTQLVQEMRDLSLIESGQMPVTLKPVELLQVVQHSIDGLQSLAERKNQQVEVNIPESLIVLADATKIEQVLRNIVHNAIKFTPQDGKIEISATANSEMATVSVCDDGQGIEESHLPRIFERFYQEDFARSEGTGLGLAIARHIVLAHDGKIWAERNPDQGTTFSFTLPLAEK